MNNSGSAAGDSAPTNLPTNAGILSATDAERNTRSGSSLDDSVNKSATALNVDGMQVSSGTSLGGPSDNTMTKGPSAYNPSSIPTGPGVQPGMQSKDSEPQGMSSLPPNNSNVFDSTGGSGAPLLSMQSGPPSGSINNPVMRPSPLGTFPMNLQGGHVPMGNLGIQGPLLSNGSTSNAKNMQAHNLTSTESFVAMQPQGMHTQPSQLLPPASGAGMSGGNSALTSSPHTLGMGQPQNIPLNSFLTSSHTLSGPQQISMSQQSHGGPSMVHNQQQGHGPNQGVAQGQAGQSMLMQQGDSGMQQMQQPVQQNWMQMRQQQQMQQQQQQQHQQQQGMGPGGAQQGQMLPQQLQGGGINNVNSNQSMAQPQTVYHTQQGGMQGQQMQYGQQVQGVPHPHQQHNQPVAQGHGPGQMQHMNSMPGSQPQAGIPPQQQGASFAGAKFSAKPWHSSDHVGNRNHMVEEIIKLLKTRRPNATEDWHEKLPHMARRLEDALYHEAADLQQYSDHSSLKQRLQQLALSMGGNKPAQNKSGLPPQQLQQQQQQLNQMRQQQFQQQQQMQKGGQPQIGNGQPQSYAPQQYQQQLARTAQAAASQYPQSGNQQMQQQQGYLSAGALDYQQQQLMQQQGQGGVQPIMHPNMPYSNAGAMVPTNGQQVVNQVPQYMMNAGDQSAPGAGGAIQYASMQGGVNRPMGMNSGNMSQQGQIMQPQGQLLASNQTQQSMGPPPHQHSSGSQGHSEEHRKQVLKQQQQRLLLLRHASKCPHENGRCPVTPHCGSMKQLWKHIMSCKDQECKIPHCVSSRYVLSHYSKCKEPTCPVCGPVREAIKRNVERSKDIVKTTRTSSGGGGGGGGGSNAYSMPAHNAPQREDPPAKRQKKKDPKEKPDERMAATLVIPSRPRPPPKSIYPLDPISCAIYCFSADEITAHFRSIHEGMKLTVAKIKEMCKPIIEDLYRVPHAQGIFGSPVDPVMLGLPDYFDVIKMPMDLGTVMKKLQDGSYRDLHHFVVDVHLTFDNAMNYNPKNSDVYILAKTLKRDFDIKYKQKVADFERNINIMRETPDACLICGETTLKFEPPVYYCNGTCAQRIRRSATYFSNNTNSYHWCNPCFNNLRENETVRLPDCTITKAELALNKKKHTEESEEGWVECEGGCKRWVHQVCSLFNARRNISDDVSYVCPLCIQKERTANPDKLIVQPTTKKMRAVDLPLTILSQFLEKRIYKRLSAAYIENAQKMGVSENDIEKCPPLFLRQVSCQDKMHTVRDGVYNRYKEKGYPTDFPCRTKCLVLFQNIDGQDVILFGMYVYEYGHKCPQPNQRRVYISYLDSVHYLRPKQYRTLVYHEILISYLDYVRARGFHTAHIWACPPQKGDDYILYIHPPDQKTPKPQILRLWYDEMLKRCVERGIVCEYTDFHTEYLADHSNDATVLPYFEGDYWVNEAEVIIKNLKSGVKEDDDESGGVGKSKRKSKSKRLVRTDAIKPMQLGKAERDPVMAKLASIIEPMKDTFFVARLWPKEYALKCAETLTAEQKASDAGESTTQQEEKLREEALSGSDVQMPAGAEVPKESEKTAGEEGKEEGQSNRDTQEEDDEDDFGKAAMSISQPGEGNDGQDGDSSNTRTLSSSVSAVQFSDFSALKRAESYSSQGLRELEDSGERTDKEGGVESGDAEEAVQTPTTPSGRNTRGLRKPKSSEAKVEVEKTEEVTEDNNMDVESSTDVVNNESKEEESGVKEESFPSSVIPGASPAPSKTCGLAKPSSSSDLNTGANASGEDVKVKSETERDAVQGEAEDSTEDTITRPVKPEVPPPPLIMVGEDMPDLKDDTEDVDDVQENEHFETRQSFLNLCQGNHYQFDQLRRAKHTSMMVLYHLHNPDAPKFVPTCSQCHIDILTGYRHHCDTCEIDFCQNCVQNAVSKLHVHPLRPMAISSTAPQQLTDEQRRERARSVQLHMQLLQHAANCVKCESKNCHRMKEFLKHDSVCTVKAANGCRLCARITNLLNIHARACRIDNCKVPHCTDLREHMRNMALRQQHMDDRRRQNMNTEYGRGGSNGGDTGANEEG